MHGHKIVKVEDAVGGTVAKATRADYRQPEVHDLSKLKQVQDYPTGRLLVFGGPRLFVLAVDENPN